MKLGDKIKLTRENRGSSREHLAALLDMDVRTYEKIENNKRDISLSETEKIANGLDISMQELLFGEPKLVFENCNENVSLYNSGTLNYQSTKEIHEIYESQINFLQNQLAEKDKQIDQLTKKIK